MLNPDFKVDNFNGSTGKFTFFLSHTHEDHLKGLKTEFNMPITDWNKGVIYCSEVSKCLVLDRFKNLVKNVVSLQMNTEYQIKGRAVTMIPSNHCPGAVMFVFKGPSGIVLHTGDFRFRPKMLTDLGLITKGKPIDYVHMDNTFATTEEEFPS